MDLGMLHPFRSEKRQLQVARAVLHKGQHDSAAVAEGNQEAIGKALPRSFVGHTKDTKTTLVPADYDGP